MFLNTSPSKREWLINNGYTIITFLPVSISQAPVDQDDISYDTSPTVDTAEVVAVLQLEDDIRLTSTSDGREQNMLLLHEALQSALFVLENQTNTGFEVRTRSCGVWNCFPALVSYCADIIEVKNVSAVKQGLSVQKPCHSCLATLQDFMRITKREVRHRVHTGNVRHFISQ